MKVKMSVACLALCLALVMGAGAVPAQCAEIGREQAFAIALKNAGVPERDAYNVEIKSGRENGIAIFKVEFETRYGDYEFEVARESGRIIGADYEVDDDWLRTLGGSPVSLDEAKRVVQKKVPGSHFRDIRMHREGGGHDARYEGELFHEGIKYEFEIDPRTGRVVDWNADLRG